MNGITKFIWSKNSNILEWNYKGEYYKLVYKKPLECVVKLKDESGFAVVLSRDEVYPNNAVIINANSTIRFFLAVPVIIKDYVCFYEIYYNKENLVVIIATRSMDYSCVINPDTGEYLDVHITK